MDTNLLDTKFARIGARLKVADRPSRRSRTSNVISLDVQADRKGEFFEIVRQLGAEAEIAVLDVQPAVPGSLIFVERAAEHRFVDITEDLTVLVFCIVRASLGCDALTQPERKMKEGSRKSRCEADHAAPRIQLEERSDSVHRAGAG